MSDEIRFDKTIFDGVDVPNIDELIDSLNTAKIAEESAINNIREGAGRHIETDGFDMDAAREAIHEMHRDGHEPGFWLTTESVEDEIREWYETRNRSELIGSDPGVAVSVEWRVVTTGCDDLMDREMFALSDRAVVRPPPEIGVIPRVRHSDGVLHYEL